MKTVQLTISNRVKNIDKTRRCEPKKSHHSWKQFWKNNSNQSWPKEYPVSGCTKEAYCGGHVNINDYDGVYIIPLCSSCNSYNKTEWVSVNPGTVAVLVEKADTSAPPQCS